MTNIVRKIANKVVEKVEEVKEYTQVSMAKTQTRNTFNQIFTKLAAQLNVPIKSLRIGIEFRNNEVIFYPYIGKDKIYDTIEGQEKKQARNIALDDYIENSLVNGWGQMISIFIGNLAIPFATNSGTTVENICVLLRPDLANYKENVIYKWDLPKEIRKSQFPECNGLPLAMLCKKVDESNEKFEENITKVRDIDIESEILM